MRGFAVGHNDVVEEALAGREVVGLQADHAAGGEAGQTHHAVGVGQQRARATAVGARLRQIHSAVRTSRAGIPQHLDRGPGYRRSCAIEHGDDQHGGGWQNDIADVGGLACRDGKRADATEGVPGAAHVERERLRFHPLEREAPFGVGRHRPHPAGLPVMRPVVARHTGDHARVGNRLVVGVEHAADQSGGCEQRDLDRRRLVGRQPDGTLDRRVAVGCNHQHQLVQREPVEAGAAGRIGVRRVGGLVAAGVRRDDADGSAGNRAAVCRQHPYLERGGLAKHDVDVHERYPLARVAHRLNLP